jgi:RND family efflux transporter MFP subunit
MATRDMPPPAPIAETAAAEAAITIAGGRSVVPVNPPQPARPTRAWPWRLALLLFLMAAAGGGLWFTWWQPTPIIATHPWKGSAIEAVYATGIVEAVDTARVGTTVAGRIVALTVQEGDSVQQGQVVAQLDDSQPRHRLEDALARLTQAQLELTRGMELMARGVRTRQDIERSLEERDKAAAGVRLINRQIDEHRVVAPLDGVVTKRPVEVGETVSAHQTLYEVVSDRRLRVAADVDERDIPLVRLGADVALRSEAFPKEAFTAAVTNIRRAGETATRTFRVEADLPAGTVLRIGMTVDVNIVTASRQNAVLVPALAVRNDPPLGGRPGAAYVFRVEDGKAVRTLVETGAIGPEVIEIRDGLTEAATIIAAPPNGLRDGQAVHVEATRDHGS